MYLRFPEEATEQLCSDAIAKHGDDIIDIFIKHGDEAVDEFKNGKTPDEVRANLETSYVYGWSNLICKNFL